jgi:hypothetical protein
MEGRARLDKIFQLRLSLPPKEVAAIREYIRLLAASSPDNLSQLIAEGYPPNLRKIKRILNLVYLLVKGTQKETFVEDFPLIAVWSIATVTYPELAKIISNDANSLFSTVEWIRKSWLERTDIVVGSSGVVLIFAFQQDSLSCLGTI